RDALPWVRRHARARSRMERDVARAQKQGGGPRASRAAAARAAARGAELDLERGPHRSAGRARLLRGSALLHVSDATAPHRERAAAGLELRAAPGWAATRGGFPYARRCALPADRPVVDGREVSAGAVHGRPESLLRLALARSQAHRRLLRR